MWDEENLYVAMRDQLRPGERPLQMLRGFDNDQDEVVHDDCYEICISMGASDPATDLKNGTTQFIGTVTGARFDAWLQTPIGGRKTDNPQWLITSTKRFNRFHTSSNVRIREIAPNRLLLTYDRIPFDWDGVAADSPERNQIFVLPIEVGKQ